MDTASKKNTANSEGYFAAQKNHPRVRAKRPDVAGDLARPIAEKVKAATLIDCRDGEKQAAEPGPPARLGPAHEGVTGVV